MRAHNRHSEFWTNGLRHYLAVRLWIDRNEPGLAAVSAVRLVRIMRRHLPTH